MTARHYRRNPDGTRTEVEHEEALDPVVFGEAVGRRNLAQGWRWRENPHTNRTEGTLLVDGLHVGSVTETREGHWKAEVLKPSGLMMWQNGLVRQNGPWRERADAVAWVEDLRKMVAAEAEETLRERQLKAAQHLLSLLEADTDTCPIVLGSARSVLKAVRNG